MPAMQQVPIEPYVHDLKRITFSGKSDIAHQLTRQLHENTGQD
jgi:hypothetical protein